MQEKVILCDNAAIKAEVMRLQELLKDAPKLKTAAATGCYCSRMILSERSSEVILPSESLKRIPRYSSPKNLATAAKKRLSFAGRPLLFYLWPVLSIQALKTRAFLGVVARCYFCVIG